jgi:hypothetical protein
VARGDHLHDGRYPTAAALKSAGTLNAAGNPVDWTQLKNVPADFADGVDDGITAITPTAPITATVTGKSATIGLATGGCANGDALKFNGSAFACAADQVNLGTVTVVGVVSPLFLTVPANASSTPTLAIQQATATQPGFLGTADFTNFSNKLAAVAVSTGLTGNGTAGSPIGLPVCAAGQVLKYGAGVWACANDLDTTNPGTVTQIAAGSGLSGGTITSSGTIAIQAGGVTSAMLGNGAVGSLALSTGAVTSNALGVGAVTSSALAAGAVTSSALAAGAVSVGTGLIGDGTPSWPIALTSTGILPGTYTAVTVDGTGRVTGGSYATTLAGYGITDAVRLQGSTPGTAQVGHLNVNGTIMGGNVTASGAVNGASVAATGSVSGSSVTATGVVTGGSDVKATNDFRYATPKSFTKFIPAATFTTTEATKLAHSADGYVNCTTALSGSPTFLHDLVGIVPDGATITSLRLYRYDNDGVNDAFNSVGMQVRPLANAAGSAWSTSCPNLTGASQNVDSGCLYTVPGGLIVNYSANSYLLTGYYGGMPVNDYIRFYGIAVTYTVDQFRP